MSNLAKIDYEKSLNAEQLKAVKNGDGFSLVISGPGSGKTRTLVYRLAFLLEKGVSTEEILLVTFTKKAAKEMVLRVEDLLGYQPKGLLAGTFHHVANLFLRRYANLIGYKNDFSIIDEDDSKNLVAACMEELGISKTANPNFPKAPIVQEIVSLAQNTRSTVKSAVEGQFYWLELSDSDILLIEKIREKYIAKKLDQNLMDYDDILLNWLKVLNDRPEIRERIASRFKYVLVDEYQDTNVIQEEIICAMGSKHQNIMAVGDDAQSIYSFRGADISNILNFAKKYPQANIFKIETNYRSTPEILDVANQSIKNNAGQIQKTLKTLRHLGGKPQVYYLESASQEAEFVARSVLALHRQGNELKSMAVLFRSKHHASELEMSLAKYNIAYVMRGGMRFFEQQHIKDILAFLRALINSKDQTAWVRALKLFDGIGPAAAEKVFLSIYEQESSEVFQDNDFCLKLMSLAGARMRDSLQLAIKILRTLVEHKKKGEADNISQMIFTILDDFYAMYLKTSFPDAQERIEDIHELAKLSLEYKDLPEMLASMSLSEDFENQGAEKGNDALTLSTIHQAKGLEWKIVFIINLKDGQFPHGKSFESQDFLEEERRLFYVAITRCKEKLFLTFPLIDWKRKGDQAGKPSRFLKEISEAVEEHYKIKGDPFGQQAGYQTHYAKPKPAKADHKHEFSSGNRLGDFGIFNKDYKQSNQRYDKSEYHDDEETDIINY